MDDHAPSTAPTRRIPAAWTGVLFPLVALAFATFFFGGRIGWWSDDYWHNQRNPVSGAVDGLVIHRGFFLRPAFYWIVPAVTTLSWKSQWPAHLLEIGSHGAVVIVLWRLLMTLGASRAAAGAASLLFMVYPAHFEALLWVSALPTSLACLVMLGIFWLTVRLARGRAGWVTVPLMVATAFGLCCLNEQPAAGIAALPLIYWAARRPRNGTAPAAQPWLAGESHLVSAILPAYFCACAAALYVALVVSDPSKPPNARSDTLVTLDQLGARAATFLDILWRRLVLKNFAGGALSTGWEQLRVAGWVAVIWGTALVAAAGVWLRAWVQRPPEPARAWPGRLLAAGAVVFFTGWLPILAFGTYEPDSRTRYWPCIGATMMLAAALSALRPAGPSRAAHLAGRLAGGLAVIVLMLPCAVMLIGVQAAFRARWHKDRAEGEALRQLIPNPAPLTFFLPIRIDETAVSTGSPVFDGHFRSAWEFPWTAPKFILSVYRRGDVRCGYYRHWRPDIPVKGADESGLHYVDRLGPAFPPIEGSGSRVPWTKALPFIVDRQGTVHIVTSVVIPSPEPGGHPVEIHIPQAPPEVPPLRLEIRRG